MSQKYQHNQLMLYEKGQQQSRFVSIGVRLTFGVNSADMIGAIIPAIFETVFETLMTGPANLKLYNSHVVQL